MAKTPTEGQAPQPVRGTEQEPPGRACGLQNEDSSEPDPGLRAEASGSSAHCEGPSPEKKAKGPSEGLPHAKARASKKQQLLATAALRDSQNITRFFCPRAESPPPVTSVPGAESASPSCGGEQGPLAATPLCTVEEDGALGHLAACPQTECTREGPR